MGKPLTVRELQWLWIPLGIWVVASVLTAVSGPFGTHEAMSLGPRSIYWAGVCGASVGLSSIAARVQNGKSLRVRLLIWLCFAAVLSAGIHSANIVLFNAWQGWGEYFYLLAIVAVVIAMVFLTIRLVQIQAEDPVTIDENRLAKFLERLPLEKRAKLIRLEAQDHYLKVVTQAGDSLILMRIGDAAKELDGGYGTQVHRSHWIARGAVSAHNRRGGRDFLTTQDGVEIPVSRNNRAQIAELMHPIGE
jgi:hypothetical protein